jgi:hypothetical protein
VRFVPALTPDLREGEREKAWESRGRGEGRGKEIGGGREKDEWRPFILFHPQKDEWLACPQVVLGARGLLGPQDLLCLPLYFFCTLSLKQVKNSVPGRHRLAVTMP